MHRIFSLYIYILFSRAINAPNSLSPYQKYLSFILCVYPHPRLSNSLSIITTITTFYLLFLCSIATWPELFIWFLFTSLASALCRWMQVDQVRALFLRPVKSVTSALAWLIWKRLTGPRSALTSPDPPWRALILHDERWFWWISSRGHGGLELVRADRVEVPFDLDL